MLTATPAPELWRSRLASAARRPVPADSVAFARIGFGFLVTFSSLRFLINGWVGRLWLEPEFHLTYTHFEWVRPLPGVGMYLLQLALAASGVAMAVGWHHRRATVFFLVGFTWTELIDAALYLNHYWFMTLMGVLMLLLPVHRHWSLDARAGRVSAQPEVQALTVWALRAQVGVVYFFAGLAKVNPDWLFDAQPLRLWLSDRSDVIAVGDLLDSDVIAYLASWSAVAFDLTIVGWLLWRRTRLAAWIAALVFHVVTGSLFQIGVFPVVMAVMALIFFDPSWPQRFVPAASIGLPSTMGSPRSPASIRRPAAWCLAVLLVLQVVLPLRHFAQPGNVRWNEDGYYLAWRVMLTEKAGFVEFDVTDPATGDVWTVTPSMVLTDWQAATAATRPDLIHATALLIENALTDETTPDLEIRADAWVSMNGRPAAALLDPTIDLTQFARGELPPDVVLDAPD